MDFLFDKTLFNGFKDKIAIVAVGYNRINSLSRLLDSLDNAEYPSNDIPLVISLDYGGGDDIHEFVENFQWKHGKKICLYHKENLKLQKHIFSCISLSEYFKGVIILEDDLYVSPVFYFFAEQSLNYYGADECVSAISLYNATTNHFTKLPMYIMHGNSDVYAAQIVETWGECFNYRMWKKFYDWYIENPNIDWNAIDMHETISSWKNAWSKYFFAYMIQKNKYYIYPYISLTTCFDDVGVHTTNVQTDNTQQVMLQFEKKDYKLASFHELYQYDVYLNPCNLGILLGLNDKELTVDFYKNRKFISKRYLLTPYYLPYSIVKTYGLRLKPIEANVYLKIDGTGLFLYDTNFRRNIKNEFLVKKNILNYYFDGFYNKVFIQYTFTKDIKIVFKKIFKKIFK